MGSEVRAGKGSRPQVFELATNGGRTDNNAETRRVQGLAVHPRMLQGKLRGGGNELEHPHHDAQALAVLLFQVVAAIEISHLAADLHGATGGQQR